VKKGAAPVFVTEKPKVTGKLEGDTVTVERIAAEK